MRSSAFAAIFLVAISAAFPAFATDEPPEAVMRTASQYLPGFQAESVKISPINGMYRVIFGANIVYISADGRYLVRGDIIDMEQGENLTELERNGIRKQAIDGLGEETMIVFAPKGQTKSTITVFTDYTCPYCAKLHREVPQLNAEGVKVRYLAFPRAGYPSPVATTLASIWCADDPQQAMTDAKSGRNVEPKECPNPVETHYEMGQRVGVRGTPAIVLDDGSMVGGYVPYDRLAGAAIQASMKSQ